MPTTKRITIAPRTVDQITVDLAGKEYIIDTPKASIGLMMAESMQSAGSDSQKVVEQLKTWVTTTFGTKQGTKVWARLADPEDPIDIPQIVELIQQITEVATPNPTT